MIEYLMILLDNATDGVVPSYRRAGRIRARVMSISFPAQREEHVSRK